MNLVPINFLSNFNLTTSEGKDNLAKEILKHEQVECPVIHRFAPHLYIREIFLPKGAMVTGSHHNFEHLNVFLKGKVQMFNDDGTTSLLEAPYMFIGKAGRKSGYILEDCIWQNIYATDETDIEKLEELLFSNPEFFKDKIQEKFELDYKEYEKDRIDFYKMLEEVGFTEEEVNKMSFYREDCIPFPSGNYLVEQGNSLIKGKGLFASGDIPNETYICPARIDGKRTPAGYLINHAKEPNCKLIKKDNGDLVVVTIKNIKGRKAGFHGDELTLDYRQALSVNKLVKEIKNV